MTSDEPEFQTTISIEIPHPQSDREFDVDLLMLLTTITDLVFQFAGRHDIDPMVEGAFNERILESDSETTTPQQDFPAREDDSNSTFQPASEVIGWAVAIDDCDDGWEISWDERVHHDYDDAVDVLRAATRKGYFAKLAEVRLVPDESQPSVEPPTLVDILVNKFLKMGMNTVSAERFASQAVEIVEAHSDG